MKSRGARIIAGEGEACGTCWITVFPEEVASHAAQHAREQVEKEKQAQALIVFKRERALELLTADLQKHIDGVSVDHSDAKLVDFTRPVQDNVRAGIDAEITRGFLIRGTTGSGKTRLMAAICREFIIQGGSDIYWTMAREMLRRIWGTYDRGKATETERAVIYKLQWSDVLAIDDLGHEGKVSDAVIGALHEVIASRNDNRLPTIVTTNLSIQEMEKLYDASIVSRMGSWFQVSLVGKDRR